MIFVFSYQREEMLKSVLKDLKGEDVTILDDGSDFKIKHPNVLRFKNGGKAKFWEKWFIALRLAEGTDDDFFLFMPSDFLNIDLVKIKEIHNELKSKPYVYNLINDGREMCWNTIKPVKINEERMQIGFTDCGFFCNREALKRIGFNIKAIDPRRFKTRGDISSGVGQFLTQSFQIARIPIYMPIKSLAFHGEHESTMHPDHRKQIKLTSK